MGLLVLASLALGSWRVYATHFASFVEADPAVVGKIFLVRGRVFGFGGHSISIVRVISRAPSPQTKAQSVVPADSGWGACDFEVKMAAVWEVGDYDVHIIRDNEIVAKGQVAVSWPTPGSQE